MAYLHQAGMGIRETKSERTEPKGYIGDWEREINKCTKLSSIHYKLLPCPIHYSKKF
jgi:hypothetical protein